ncbi:MAG: FAD-dependent oxidoreductase [Actinomycetota bacterium]|nr:FAD-dependent oxidoreductase [Actinomycetota bacterium]
MRIAIVGSGVSGLVCAHLLAPRHDVTLFEADERAGGHAHTVDTQIDGVAHAVDTGFIVYNERNYPILTRLFAELGVATQPSDMSFAMADDAENVEWCGSSLTAVFAQRRNLARPAFLRMLLDIGRFNRSARRLLAEPENFGFTLEEFLERGRYCREFIEWYLVPMGAAIWSADPSEFVKFPAAAFIRFFDNHGLLGVRDRPQWRTVVGGSKRYVNAITDSLGSRLRLSTPVTSLARVSDGVAVRTGGATEVFDHVIVATHSDQALALLESPTRAEREILSAIRYRANDATLHTDERLMPRRARAHASWNWRRRRDVHAPTLTYDLTRLEGLTAARRVYLTLNQVDAVDPDQVLATMTYWHPIFDSLAMSAQRRHGEISGRDAISYAGAYWGYGFHEDGARSAVDVCRSLGAAVAEGVA